MISSAHVCCLHYGIFHFLKEYIEQRAHYNYNYLKWCLVLLELLIHNIVIILWSPLPKIDLEQYDVIVLVLGILHNVFCGIVLITYFLSNHPTLPKISVVGEKIRWLIITTTTIPTVILIWILIITITIAN